MNARIDNIVKWAKDRRIIQNGTVGTQANKLTSEFGELAGSLYKFSDIKDDIGDCFVVCVILLAMSDKDPYILAAVEPSKPKSDSGFFLLASAQLGDIADYAAKSDTESMHGSIVAFIKHLQAIAHLKGNTLLECVDVAYDDIKDRKGYLNEHGCFIKEAENEVE